MTHTSNQRFHLGQWRVQADLNRLVGPSGDRTLEPKVMGVLLCMAQRHGSVVSKTDLIQEVWNGQRIADSAITRSVSELRRALGDDAQNPTYIETIPTRGYRLVAVPLPLEPASEGSCLTDSETTIPDRSQVSFPMGLPRSRFLYQIAILAFMISAALSFAWRKYDLPAEFVEQAPSLSPVRLMQVSTEPGLESFPDYSPDSSSVVYSGLVDGSFELFVQQLTPGGDRLQLTFDGNQNVQATWSPDGQRIAYHSITSGGIWLIPALGGEARRLSGFGSSPDWLPSSRELVFQSGSFVDAVPSGIAALPPSRLYRVSIAGGEPRPITRSGVPVGGHGAPKVSPLGNRLLFAASDTTGRTLHTVKFDGSDLRTVAGVPTLGAVFSQDGRYLYSSGSFQGEKWLWRTLVSPTTGEAMGAPERLTRGSFRGLSYSSSERRLMAEVVEQKSHLFTLDIDTETLSPLGPERQLTRGTNFRDSSPAISPDGRLIAYRQVRFGQQDQIWLIARDGTQNSQLTLDPSIPAHFPSWTPDGSAVLFQKLSKTSKSSKSFERINLIDKSSETWLEIPRSWQYVRLSRDGELAVFHQASETPTGAPDETGDSADSEADSPPVSTNVYVAGTSERRPSSHQAQPLTSIDGFAGYPILSTNKTVVAYEVQIAGRNQIELRDLDTGAVRRLTESGENWPGSFIGDRYLTLVAQREGVWNLYIYDLLENIERPLTSNTSAGVYYRVPNASRDGKFLVYERGTVDGDLWQVQLEG